MGRLLGFRAGSPGRALAGALALGALGGAALGCDGARGPTGPEPVVAPRPAAASAAPADAAEPPAQELLGATAQGWVGATLKTLEGEPVALELERVFATGPAAGAGLLAGDRIEAVDGAPVGDAAARQRLLHPAPGSAYELVVRRGSEQRTVRLEAERRPGALELAQRELFGKPAPELTGAAPAAGELGGGLASLRGRVVLIDFWASFCGPCRAASAELGRMLRELEPQGLSVVGVAEEAPEPARAAAAEWPLAYPSLADEPGVLRARYLVEELPTLFVVDRKGIVRGMLVSYGKDSLAAVERHVKKLLAEAP
ncbi:MAG: redoxin domain-containing protein [Myxococcales bacterium]|nr:redoxin domain-containing protein [Myxococcales bacterium]